MRRRGLAIVVGWSVFPFVPTDAICYVAGTLRMPIGRFLLGVTLGKDPARRLLRGRGDVGVRVVSAGWRSARGSHRPPSRPGSRRGEPQRAR